MTEMQNNNSSAKVDTKDFLDVEMFLMSGRFPVFGFIGTVKNEKFSDKESLIRIGPKVRCSIADNEDAWKKILSETDLPKKLFELIEILEKSNINFTIEKSEPTFDAAILRSTKNMPDGLEWEDIYGKTDDHRPYTPTTGIHIHETDKQECNITLCCIRIKTNKCCIVS